MVFGTFRDSCLDAGGLDVGGLSYGVWHTPSFAVYGGPASQWNSTPAASVRMSGGQELIHARRIITDMGVTARPRVRGG